MLAQQKSGLHTLFTSGSSAFGEVDNLITTQSANLGCFLHDTADILSNLAQPTNLTNLSQGLAYNQYFFGAVDNIAVEGVAKPTTTDAAAEPQQTFLRTRLLLPPILERAGVVLPDANSIPATLPGRGVRHRVRQRCRPGQPARLHARRRGARRGADGAGGERRARTRHPGRRSSSAAYRVPATSRGALLALGGLVVPALFLAWGARPSRRRTRRRA